MVTPPPHMLVAAVFGQCFPGKQPSRVVTEPRSTLYRLGSALFGVAAVRRSRGGEVLRSGTCPVLSLCCREGTRVSHPVPVVSFVNFLC